MEEDRTPPWGSLKGHIIVALLTAWWTLGVGNLVYALGEHNQLKRDKQEKEAQERIRELFVQGGPKAVLDFVVRQYAVEGWTIQSQSETRIQLVRMRRTGRHLTQEGLLLKVDGQGQLTSTGTLAKATKAEAARVLGTAGPFGEDLVHSTRILNPVAARKVLRYLEEAEAPPFVLEAVIRRTEPAKLAPFEEGKPKTVRTLRASRLAHKELQERAGVSKNTLRLALYEHVNERSASAIAPEPSRTLWASQRRRQRP